MAPAQELGPQQLLRVLPTAVLWLLCLAPPLRALVRSRFSPFVRRTVVQQLETIARIQRLRSPLLTLIARFSAWTVTTEFYLVALPLVYWSS